jgi:phosphonate transport system substrate-binding protein
VHDIRWQERLRRFDAGRIQVAWMCGLPYVWRADRDDSGFRKRCTRRSAVRC